MSKKRVAIEKKIVNRQTENQVAAAERTLSIIGRLADKGRANSPLMTAEASATESRRLDPIAKTWDVDVDSEARELKRSEDLTEDERKEIFRDVSVSEQTQPPRRFETQDELLATETRPFADWMSESAPKVLEGVKEKPKKAWLVKAEAFLAELKAKAEEEYRMEAPLICAKYKLDIVKDKPWVKEIIRAQKALAPCEFCKGLPCDNQLALPIRKVPVIDFANRRIHYAPCVWERAIERDLNMRRSGLPKMYRDATWHRYKVEDSNRQAVEAAQMMLPNPDVSLYLSGETGAGKTLLATLIAKDFLGAGKTVKFRDVPSLLVEIQATFSSYTISMQEIIDDFIRCDLLILDDLGAGRQTDWAVSTLYTIINQRYNAGRPVLITSNYSLGALGEKLTTADPYSGQRIISRLAQMCLTVDLGDKDRRLG